VFLPAGSKPAGFFFSPGNLLIFSRKNIWDIKEGKILKIEKFKPEK